MISASAMGAGTGQSRRVARRKGRGLGEGERNVSRRARDGRAGSTPRGVRRGAWVRSAGRTVARTVSTRFVVLIHLLLEDDAVRVAHGARGGVVVSGTPAETTRCVSRRANADDARGNLRARADAATRARMKSMRNRRVSVAARASTDVRVGTPRSLGTHPTPRVDEGKLCPGERFRRTSRRNPVEKTFGDATQMRFDGQHARVCDSSATVRVRSSPRGSLLARDERVQTTHAAAAHRGEADGRPLLFPLFRTPRVRVRNRGSTRAA